MKIIQSLSKNISISFFAMLFTFLYIIPQNVVGQSGMKGQMNRSSSGETSNGHSLWGESNCRLSSTFDAYLSTVQKGNSSPLILLSNGTGDNVRFDFKMVDSELPTKGFYIVTRERDARVLMVQGRNLSFELFNRMDGKAKEAAQWTFENTGKNKKGNTQYLLAPVKNPDNLMLAANPENHRLILSAGNSPDARKGNGQKILPSPLSTTWTCECIF